MAFSKKRTRSLDSDEEEEAHPKKEINLNKEPEAETDEEAEVDENANQHEEYDRERDVDIVTASFAISHMMFIRNLTQAENQRNMEPETETDELDDQEEEEADEDIDSSDEIDLEAKQEDEVNHAKEEEVDLDKILASVVRRERTKKYITQSKDEDDSEQTLSLLSRWEIPATPPEKIIYRGLVEQCSRPFRKQLTESDVSVEREESSKLALSKSQVTKKFLPLLDQESEIPSGKDGIRVSVYGPDGKVYEMKMCVNEGSVYLTAGWRKFFGDYELKEFCDIVTIWMFRHYRTRQICLAIDSKRFVFWKQLSKRISMAAFEDSD